LAHMLSMNLKHPILLQWYFQHFPHGTGDPTNPAPHRSVSLTDGLKHLLKYGETNEHTQMQQW
jgi:hypothetical protein